jgi:hypothetical protein
MVKPKAIGVNHLALSGVMRFTCKTVTPVEGGVGMLPAFLKTRGTFIIMRYHVSPFGKIPISIMPLYGSTASSRLPVTDIEYPIRY